MCAENGNFLFIHFAAPFTPPPGAAAPLTAPLTNSPVRRHTY